MLFQKKKEKEKNKGRDIKTMIETMLKDGYK